MFYTYETEKEYAAAVKDYKDIPREFQSQYDYPQRGDVIQTDHYWINKAAPLTKEYGPVIKFRATEPVSFNPREASEPFELVANQKIIRVTFYGAGRPATVWRSWTDRTIT